MTGEPALLATLQAPRRGGVQVAVYSDGTLAYSYPPKPKRRLSRLTVYSPAQLRRGLGENLTPEGFVRRHVEIGYTRVGE